MDHGITDEEAKHALSHIVTFFEEGYPLKRAGTSEDIAYATVYLASDESPHIAGENIVVDTEITIGRNAKLQVEGGTSMQRAMSGA